MTVSDTALLEQRREEILGAARACFAEKGFTATTMAYIAKRVGMSMGNLYNYFPGKDAILNELAKKECLRNVEYAKRFEQGEIDLKEQRASLIECMRERMQTAHARATLEVFAQSTHNEKIAQIVHRFDKEVRDFLAVLYRNAGMSPEEVQAKIVLDMLLMDGIMIRVLAQPDLDVRLVSEIVADRILQMR